MMKIQYDQQSLLNSNSGSVVCHTNHHLNIYAMFQSQSANHGSQTKQVQDIAAESDHLPERYIRKQDEDFRSVNNPPGSSPISGVVPVIDVSLLTSSPSELDKLKSAASSWGCFQAINHGIESSFLEKVHEISKLFFRFSVEERKKYMRAEDSIEGYGNDMVLSEKQTLDWNDRLYLSVLPKHQQKLQFWPQNPTHFREVVDEFSSKIELFNEVVQKALARSLNLDENCFLDQYGKITSTMQARFNYYPPCPWPDRVFGVKPHSDISAITVLLQDKEVEGFQVLKDDQWIGVPIVHDALTIFIGDQLEVMSNGVFKSTMHRVLINSKDARISVAFFCMPQTEMDIGPVDRLVTDETPRLYKNVTFSVDSFFNNYQEGRRAIDACKI